MSYPHAACHRCQDGFGQGKWIPFRADHSVCVRGAPRIGCAVFFFFFFFFFLNGLLSSSHNITVVVVVVILLTSK